MALTARDILMDADMFKRAYPGWPGTSAPASGPLSALRASLIAKGCTASSPDKLDAEGEQLAREERWT